MPHIVFLCDEYPPKSHGGIGVFTKNIANGLVQNGFEVTVISLGREEKEYYDGKIVIKEYKGNFLPLISNFINKLRLRRFLSKLMQEQPFQVLESPDWNGLLYLSHKFNRNDKVTKVVRLHGSMTYLSNETGTKANKLMAFFEKKTLKAADQIVSVSDYIYISTANLIPEIKQKPHTTIYNGVNIDTFSPIKKEPTDELTVLFIGRLSRLKGIYELVIAWNEVHAKIPQAKLILSGDDSSYDENPQIKWSEAIKQLLTADALTSVNYIGTTDHDKLPELISTADLCVFPSKMEAMGIVVIEAMAMAKPVIFTKLGPGPEVIDDEKSGILVNPNNSSEIATAIINTLRNKAKRDELGLMARKKVETTFNSSFILNKNIEFYKTLINHAG